MDSNPNIIHNPYERYNKKYSTITTKLYVGYRIMQMIFAGEVLIITEMKIIYKKLEYLENN